MEIENEKIMRCDSIKKIEKLQKENLRELCNILNDIFVENAELKLENSMLKLRISILRSGKKSRDDAYVKIDDFEKFDDSE